MLTTTNGLTVDGATISTTMVHVSRSDRPEQEWNPVAIISFADNPVTEALLTDPAESITLREEQETDTTILTTTYHLEGVVQVLHEETQTYVWYWLDRVETNERVNPAALEQLKLQGAQIQAQADRTEFIEDCMAEMATVVYTL